MEASIKKEGSSLPQKNTNFKKYSLKTPVKCKNNLVLKHKGYNYYIIDLKKADFDQLDNIIQACELVERECWDAQEDFYDYIKKCDILAYTEKDGELAGFNLATLLFSEKHCIFSNDESMVLKAHRGNSLARNAVNLSVRWVYTNMPETRRIKKIVPLSISANPRVVNGYYKFRNIFYFFKQSFKPSPALINIFMEYLKKNNLYLVHEDYPFCIKNLFPGSNQFSKSSKKYQFSKGVKEHMPPEFDHVDRGDAFAYMVRFGKKSFWFMNTLFMITGFGSNIWTNKNIGFFRKENREKISTDANIDRSDYESNLHVLKGRTIPKKASAI